MMPTGEAIKEYLAIDMINPEVASGEMAVLGQMLGFKEKRPSTHTVHAETKIHIPSLTFPRWM